MHGHNGPKANPATKEAAVHYRLAPFCTWHQKDGMAVVETPDHRITLRQGAEDALLALQKGEAEDSTVVQALKRHDAVVGASSPELELLYALDTYFRRLNVGATATRKGATKPEAELPGMGYVVSTKTGVGGYGWTADNRNLALLKAAAEAYEQLSCRSEVNRELLVDPAHTPPMDHTQFVRYAPWQLQRPGFPFGTEPSGQWVQITELSTGKPFRIPIELVCYPVRARQRIITASSNGVACHPSYDEAVFISALELIERDALMVHWFWKAPREQIAVPPSLQERVKRLESLGFTCTFLNLTLELAPVVLAILRRDAPRYPRLTLGMACRPSPLDAIEKALQEVEVNSSYFDMDMPVVGRAEDIQTVVDHEYWYDQPENHAEILAHIAQRVITADAIPAGPPDVPSLGAALRRAGLRWFVASLNPVGQAQTRLHVVRSLIPKLTQIAFGYMMEPLGQPRILRPPVVIGKGQHDSSRQSLYGYRVQPFA
jgi:thiazole/oxazole-forming peptide maturase SagD family component